MKRNLLTVVLTVVLSSAFLNNAAFAQKHHGGGHAVAHHNSGGGHTSGGSVHYNFGHQRTSYPLHYNQQFTTRVVTPSFNPVAPSYHVPTHHHHNNWYGNHSNYNSGYYGRDINCNPTRSRYFNPNVQPIIQVVQVPQAVPNVVPRRVPAPQPHATPEQLIAISQAAAPKHLTAEQYDRATGKLSWPEALQTSDFAADRATLEQIFADRVGSTDQEWKSKSDDVRRLTSSLRNHLTAQVKDMRPMDFVAAKKFLDGLSREISSEVGAG